MILKEIQYTNKSGKKALKIEYKCDKCGNIQAVNKYGFLKRKKQICNHCSTIISGKNRKGIPSPLKGIKKPHLQGNKSPKWKGGRYVDKHGYVRIRSENWIESRNKWGKYDKEHRIVAEKMLGRKLKSQEHVHHLDGNKQNNIESNLIITDNLSHHRVIHVSLQDIGYELYKRGIILFNREKNEYELPK